MNRKIIIICNIFLFIIAIIGVILFNFINEFNHCKLFISLILVLCLLRESQDKELEKKEINIPIKLILYCSFLYCFDLFFSNLIIKILFLAFCLITVIKEVLNLINKEKHELLIIILIVIIIINVVNIIISFF